MLIAGARAAKELSARNTRSLGGAVAARLMAAHEPEVDLLVDAPKGAPLGEGEFAANLAMGLRLRNYRFGKYQTKDRPDKPKLLTGATFVTAKTAEAKRLDQRLAAVAEGVHFARDLTNERPNVLLSGGVRRAHEGADQARREGRAARRRRHERSSAWAPSSPSAAVLIARRGSCPALQRR